jgi:2-amino-4-hydroxy-6-hydroxymethyldihydropteridine diphosphokinase
MAIGPHWVPCCIAVGSNLDDPVAQVRWALDALAKLPESRLQTASRLYRNPPMGPVDQPWYVNAVVVLLTRLEPEVLLHRLQALERERGRERSAAMKWGPRTLDLDILTWGGHRISTPALTVPHPGISERNFVLFPLRELAPRLNIPGQGSVAALAAALDGSGLETLD